MRKGFLDRITFILAQPESLVMKDFQHDRCCFCTSALEGALAKHGKPDIFNTGQGGQLTYFAFINALYENGIRIPWTAGALVGQRLHLNAFDARSRSRCYLKMGAPLHVQEMLTPHHRQKNYDKCS